MSNRLNSQLAFVALLLWPWPSIAQDTETPLTKTLSFDTNEITKAFQKATGASNATEFAVLFDGKYAGDIDSVIAAPPDNTVVSLVAREDGLSWTNPKATIQNSYAYILFEALNRDLFKNCVEQGGNKCGGAHSNGEASAVIAWNADNWPVAVVPITMKYPDRNPRDTFQRIDFRSDPPGAKVIIENAEHWEKTNCTIGVKTDSNGKMSSTAVFILDKRSNGPISIPAGNNEVRYNFEKQEVTFK